MSNPIERLTTRVQPWTGAPWVIVAFVVLYFWRILVGESRFAFRDVSHFFTPLYGYLAERTRKGEWALWNPLDQTGIPIIGESTTAMFYPVRLIVYGLLPNPAVAMGVYVVFHILLAAFATRHLAAKFGCPAVASNLVAFSYVGSGTVLFLACNPPFLVGAAWLPTALTVLAPDSSPRDDTANSNGSRFLPLAIAGISLAMMILAGDPQTAIHACLVIALAVTHRFAHSASIRIAIDNWYRDWKVVFIPGVMAVILSAPQIMGSLDWVAQSKRARAEQSASTERPWNSAPIRGSHRAESYRFSVPPWHALELIVPNGFGSLLPIHQRWSQVLPGDGQMWTPSLYMGALAILLVGFRPCGGEARCEKGRPSQPAEYRQGDVVVPTAATPWRLIALAALLSSFGVFGGLWLVQNVFRVASDWDSGIGGPYWFLQNWLPGYASFRYPAKWLPVFSLSVAMHAGLTLPTLTNRRAMALAKWAAALASISFVGLFICFSTFPPSFSSSVSTPSDAFWGPLQMTFARTELLASLFHSSLAFAAITLWIWSNVRSRPADGRLGSVAMTGLFFLLAVDLFAAHRTLVPTINRDQESSVLTTFDQPPTASRWLRTQESGGWPDVWRTTSSANRLLEVELSGQKDWFGRWHLAQHENVFNSSTSIQSRAIDEFWQSIRTKRIKEAAQAKDNLWPSIRRWLDIDGRRHQTGNALPTVPESPGDTESGTLLLSRSIAEVDPSFSMPIRFDSLFDWNPNLKLDQTLFRVVSQD
ncbi:MAG: hypothetical protein AAF989_11765, partial [Planctomycetota bacterium]